MARRHGDEPTPKDKGSRSEPNLELPSFRLGRRKKTASEKPAPPPVEPSPGNVEPSVRNAEKSVRNAEKSVGSVEKSGRRAKQPPAPPKAAPKPPAQPNGSAPAAKRLAPKRRPPAPPKPDEVLVAKRVPKPPVVVQVSGKEPQEMLPRGADRLRPDQGSSPTEEISPVPPKRERKAKEPKAKKEPKAPRKRRTAPLAWLPGWLGAILTGAACGALTVVLAWATAQGCDAVRGVGTCGSFGIVALVAILGIDVIVATGLLRLFRVGDPTTTSVLGVGLVAVSAMLFFLKDTQSHAMVYVIPILMAVTFAMSWWVTQAIAPGNDD